MKLYGLLAVAVVCAIAGFAADRFDYELCHRGIPIAWVVAGLPLAGLAAGAGSFLQRRRGWTVAANILAALVNVYLLYRAVLAIAGQGYLSC